MSRSSPMAKTQTANLSVAELNSKAGSPRVSLEKTEKGRSMWELLLQMRAVLPYLSRLMPLLEPVLDGHLLKSSADIRALQQSVTDMQTGNRDLEVQTRNQALQMERIEAQMARLRVAQENAVDESRLVYDEIRTLRRSLVIMGVITSVLVLITAVLVSFLLIRP